MAQKKTAKKAQKKSTKKGTKKKVAKKKVSSTKPSTDDGEEIWDQKKVRDFTKGKITLGELQGFDKKTQYKIAKMGYNLYSQGKYTEANQLFMGLVALDPRDPYFLLACGSIAQQRDDLKEADKWYSEALKHAPDHTVAYANRGEVRMELGRLQEGASDLIDALKADPKLDQSTSRRARALLVGLKATLEEGAQARKKAAAKSR